MSTNTKRNFQLTLNIGFFTGAIYGLFAGALTLFSYHQLIPDIFIFPIYSAVFYGIVGLMCSLLITTLVTGLFHVSGIQLYENLLFAVNIGWLASSFVLFMKMDRSSVPTQLAFLNKLGYFGMGFLLIGLFFLLAICMLIANRVILKGAFASSKKWLWSFAAMYAIQAALFISVDYFKKNDAVDSAAASNASAKLNSMAAKTNDTKILLIGVDGADWQILQKLVDDGEVPNFSRLIQQGVYGDLKTYKPTKSPVIWSSIGTGKSMHKHGILDFVCRKIPTLNTLFWNYYPLMFGASEFLDLVGIQTLPVNNHIRKTKAFWNILNDVDIPVGVLGWWPTWPADEVLGFIVSDRFMWDTVNETLSSHFGMTYPDTLIDEIQDKLLSMGQFKQQAKLLRFVTLPEAVAENVKNEIDSLKIGPRNYHNLYTDDHLKNALSYLGWIYLRDQNKKNLGLYLGKKFQPQVYAIYLKGIDPVQHAFWRWTRPEDFDDIQPVNLALFQNTIREYYRYTDEILGELLTLADDRTMVMILSDHGFESSPRDGFWKSGGHGNPVKGVFILSGKNVKKNHRIEKASVLDITPTLLYNLGLPIGRDMDGQVLTDVFEEDFVQDHPIEFIPTYDAFNFQQSRKPLTSTSDEKLKEHLKSLGYIK
ncbi:MAG: alkaline phosphatase family protein [bacterium]